MIKKIKNAKILIPVLIALLALITAAGVSLGWINKPINRFGQLVTQGSIRQNYFHCGTGTAEDPFVITRPVHYYHLSELYLRYPEFAGNDYYYQLGYDLDGDGDLEFYEYNDAGEYTGNYSDVLNMESYNGENAILPIGSSKEPFNGTFDGSGLTVRNLHIKSTEETLFGTYYTADVGIFGYIGGTANIHDAYYDYATLDLSGTDATATSADNHDANLHIDPSMTGSTTPDMVYVGYIAGHMVITARCDNFYVNHCTIKGGNSDKASSGFGYFGCVETEDGELLQSLETEVAEGRSSSGDSGFGGSFDMYKIFTRVSELKGQATDRTYPTEEVITIDEVAGTRKTEVVSTGTNNNYRRYYDENQGSYYYSFVNTSNSYMYMAGLGNVLTKKVTTYIYKNEYLDAWFIKKGTNYLSLDEDGKIISVTDEAAAAKWIFDEENHIYAVVEGPEDFHNLYLNNDNGKLAMQETAATSWTRTEENALFCTGSEDIEEYLDYDGEWLLTRNKYLLIGDGIRNYISVNGANIINSTNADTATHWFVDETDDGMVISTRTTDRVSYLSLEGTLTAGSTATVWQETGEGYLYTAVDDIEYYLYFDSTARVWRVFSPTGIKIKGSGNHYLSANAGGVIDATTEAGAASWQIQGDGSDNQIFTILNGQKYYLTYNGELTVSTQTPADAWHRTGSSFYVTSNGVDFYLKNENSTWTVTPLAYYTINNGGTAYLRVTGNNAFANGTSSNATHFYFTDLSGDNPSGKVFCIVDGNTYYLRNNNGALATSNEAYATSWQNDGNSLYVESGNTTYALEYTRSGGTWSQQGTWDITTLQGGSVITDGEGNYLRITGTQTTSFSNTTDPDEATEFTFSSTGTNPGGYISARSGYTTVYLRNNNGTLNLSTSTQNRTSWSNNGNNIYNGNYKLYYDNGWKLGTSPSGGYRISDGTHYITATVSGTWNPQVTLGYSTDKDDAAIFNAKSGAIGTKITSGTTTTTYYLNSDSSNNLTLSTTSVQWSDDGNGRLRYRTSSSFYSYRYIQFNNGWKVTTTQRQGTVLTIEEIVPKSIVTGKPVEKPTVKVNEYSTDRPSLTIITNTVQATSIVMTEKTVNPELEFISTRYQVVEKTVENPAESGHPSYFPLRVQADDEGGSGYDVSDRNTGYIISGSHESTSNRHADIRISQYSIRGNISNSYSNGELRTVYTFDGNRKTLTDADKNKYYAYRAAEEKFLATLGSSSNVYGLHFMDATISPEHTIFADKVTILGKTYYNYELPEDAIDFRLVERGVISFFAGTYFQDNDCFFSLHQIFRNSDTSISDIKEIKAIYEHAEALPGSRPYIYRFSDDTYTNSDGSYSGATSLDPAYKTEPVFKTEWITNPSSVTDNYVYYFEIPCNGGEYALGSVDGGIGAYLLYLDIGANIGGIINNIVSEEGNTVANTYDIDFRTNPDSIGPVNKVEGIDYNSVLQFAVSLPEGASPDDFSISVDFTRDVDNPDYSDGMYCIHVTNKTGRDSRLNVFLCDDDRTIETPFKFAYRIIYTNSTHTDEIFVNVVGLSYYQAMATFTIPSSGDMYEEEYS